LSRVKESLESFIKTCESLGGTPSISVKPGVTAATVTVGCKLPRETSLRYFMNLVRTGPEPRFLIYVWKREDYALGHPPNLVMAFPAGDTTDVTVIAIGARMEDASFRHTTGDETRFTYDTKEIELELRFSVFGGQLKLSHALVKVK